MKPLDRIASIIREQTRLTNTVTPMLAAEQILAEFTVTEPRTITTAEELDALAIGSIVRCEDGEGFGMNVAERKKAGWEYVGSSIAFQSFHLAADELPFTVLWEPR